MKKLTMLLGIVLFSSMQKCTGWSVSRPAKNKNVEEDKSKVSKVSEKKIDDSSKEIHEEPILECLNNILKLSFTHQINDKKVDNQFIELINAFFTNIKRHPLESKISALQQLNANLLLFEKVSSSNCLAIMNACTSLWKSINQNVANNKNPAQAVFSLTEKLSSATVSRISDESDISKINYDLLYPFFIDFWVENIKLFKQVLGLNEKSETSEITNKDLAEQLIYVTETCINKTCWTDDNKLGLFNDFTEMLNYLVNFIEEGIIEWETSFLKLRSMIIGRFGRAIAKHKFNNETLGAWESAVVRKELDFALSKDAEFGKELVHKIIANQQLKNASSERRMDKKKLIFS